MKSRGRRLMRVSRIAMHVLGTVSLLLLLVVPSAAATPPNADRVDQHLPLSFMADPVAGP
jgi:hypothetical protein